MLRYGDALNPWGDLITMARLWCVLGPDSRLLLGVPAAPKDVLVFNSNRVYGPVQFAHLFANFDHVFSDYDEEMFDPECEHCYQPMHYLRPIKNKKENEP